MSSSEEIVVQVKRGTHVKVQEVDHLENDRTMIATAPRDLKIAVKRGDSKAVSGISTITMCG